MPDAFAIEGRWCRVHGEVAGNGVAGEASARLGNHKIPNNGNSDNFLGMPLESWMYGIP
ncbi:hypothetical protein BME24068_00709 [Burkholderia metallica]|nr:hypothetical protein BME24068_00709 [Burkholderia metallica]